MSHRFLLVLIITGLIQAFPFSFCAHGKSAKEKKSSTLTKRLTRELKRSPSTVEEGHSLVVTNDGRKQRVIAFNDGRKTLFKTPRAKVLRAHFTDFLGYSYLAEFIYDQKLRGKPGAERIIVFQVSPRIKKPIATFIVPDTDMLQNVKFAVSQVGSQRKLFVVGIGFKEIILWNVPSVPSETTHPIFVKISEPKLNSVIDGLVLGDTGKIALLTGNNRGYLMEIWDIYSTQRLSTHAVAVSDRNKAAYSPSPPELFSFHNAQQLLLAFDTEIQLFTTSKLLTSHEETITPALLPFDSTGKTLVKIDDSHAAVVIHRKESSFYRFELHVYEIQLDKPQAFCLKSRSEMPDRGAGKGLPNLNIPIKAITNGETQLVVTTNEGAHEIFKFDMRQSTCLDSNLVAIQ